MTSKLAACIIAGFLCLPAFAVQRVHLEQESHQLTELRWSGPAGRSYQWQVVTEVDGVLTPWPGYSGRTTSTGVTLTPPLTLEGVWYGRVRDVTYARTTWVMSPPVLVHGIDLHASPRSGLIPTDDTGYANLGRLPDRVTDGDIVWSVKPRSAATLTREGIGNRVQITPHAKVGKKFTVTATIDVDASLDAVLSKRFKVGEANLAVEIANVPDTVLVDGAIEPTAVIEGTASGPIDYGWSVDAGYFLGETNPQESDSPTPVWKLEDVAAGTDATVTLTVNRGGYVRTATAETTVAESLSVSIDNVPSQSSENDRIEPVAVIGGIATGAVDYLWTIDGGYFLGESNPRESDGRSPLWVLEDVASGDTLTISLTVNRGGFVRTASAFTAVD